MAHMPVACWTVFKVKQGRREGMWRMTMKLDGRTLAVRDCDTWGEAIQSVAKGQRFYPALTHVGKRHTK